MGSFVARPCAGLLALLALLTIFLAPAPVSAATPAGYYLVWADEFSGSAMDTTKWNHWLLGARRDAINVADAVTVSNGNLVITTYTSNGVHYTGMISTQGTFRTKYGYWESRILWADTNGMWSAYWMQSPTMGNNIYDPQTSGCEIDILEHRYVDSSGLNINSQGQANIHWNGYGSDHKSVGSGNKSIGTATSYHSYGFLWTPSSYNFSLDGTSFWTGGSAPNSRSTEFMILSSEVQNASWAGNIPAGGYGARNVSTTKMTVDYVRYYAPTSALFWTGGSSAFWTNSGNWLSNFTPVATSDVTFGYLSKANLATTLGQDLAVDSLTFLETSSGVSISGSKLTLGAGGVDAVSASNDVNLNSAVHIGANQIWRIGGSRRLNVNGVLSGLSTLTKAGTGTLVLGGSNSFSGILYLDTGLTTTNNDGEVRVTSSDALALVPSPLYMRNYGAGSSTFQLDGATGSVRVAHSFDIGGRSSTTPALQNIAGSNTVAGNLILQTGGGWYYVQSDAGTLVLAGTNRYVGTLTAGRLIGFAGAGTNLVTGRILNATNGAPIEVSKAGSGTLILANDNTYTNGTRLYQGILQPAHNRALGTGPVTADSSTNTARVVLGDGVTITNALLAQSVNATAGNFGLIMAADNTSATWSGPVWIYANAASGGHFAGPTTGGILYIAGPVISDPTNTVLVRAGNVRFSGGGDYRALQIRSHTTSLGAANGLAAKAVVDLAGNGSSTTATTLELNGYSQRLGGLRNLVAPLNAARVSNTGPAATLSLDLGTGAESFGGSIVGNLGLTLLSGTQTLARSGTTSLNGLYTYSGSTTVSGGKLILGAGITLPGTPLISIAPGAEFNVAASGFTLASGRSLQGSGTVVGSLTVLGALTPGDKVGSLTVTGAVTLGSGGSLLIDLKSTNNVPGVEHDLLKVESGSLTVSASAASPFVIKLTSLDGAGNPGPITAFSPLVPSVWTIATASVGIVGVEPGDLIVDASAFQKDLAGGSFAIAQSGSQLQLRFTPAPAPAVITSATFVPDGAFVVNATGTPGVTYRLLATPSLSPPVTWTPVTGAVASASGALVLRDTVLTNLSRNFYRVVAP